MKLVLFTRDGSAGTAGVLTEHGVVPLDAFHGPTALVNVIDHLSELHPDADTLPLSEVRLLPPLPRPGKILCSTATYAESHAGGRAPLLFTLKSAESVIGPGQTVQLPDARDQWQFVTEAELGLVIR